MTELVFASNDFAKMKAALLAGDSEYCAIGYAHQMRRPDGTRRLLVRDIQFPVQSDYTRRGAMEAELSPDFIARVTKQARRDGTSILFAHSHLGTQAPRFSDVDTSGEKLLSKFLAHRHPTQHVALVISQGGVLARVLGGEEYLRIVSAGEQLTLLSDPAARDSPIAAETHDRQVRAFGQSGQQALSKLHVAIVGLGGTGSIVAEQLVHLGVRRFMLVDPDILEATNLNRVASATHSDIGKPKVDVAAHYIGRLDPESRVEVIQGDIMRQATARKLLDADVIFGCTDSHGSRAVIQQVSYQYLIPYIDMGVTIIANEQRLADIYGRVQLLAPGLACFACDNLLDANEVRRDMMTAFERQADPYIQGQREPAPAVMSLNGTVASLAVTMLLAIVTGIPSPARHLLYNAKASTVRPVRALQNPHCYICSRSGAFARGDSWPLFARGD